MLPALQPPSPRGTLRKRNITPPSGKSISQNVVDPILKLSRPVVLLKRNLNHTAPTDAQTAPLATSSPKSILKSSSDSKADLSPSYLRLTPLSILRRPTLSRPQSTDTDETAPISPRSMHKSSSDSKANLPPAHGLAQTTRRVLRHLALSRSQSNDTMSDVLGCMSARDLNAVFNKSVANPVVVVEQREAHMASEAVPTGLDLTSSRSDFARSEDKSESGKSYTTAASEIDDTREMFAFAMLHPSLSLNNAIHSIINTYQPTTSSSITQKKDDTAFSGAIVYRADHFNADGIGQPSEQMDLTGLMKNVFSGSRQKVWNKFAKRFSAKPGSKEAFLAQPSSYAILPVFDEASDTLCWWSIAIDPPQSGEERSKIRERHRETEAYNSKVNAASRAWWDVPPELSVLARTVARARQDSVTSTDASPSTRQHRFSNSSFGSSHSLTDHQSNLLSTLKGLGSPSEASSVKSRPITIDSGVDMSYGSASMIGGLTIPEIAPAGTRMSYAPPQRRNEQSSNGHSLSQHQRVMSQNSEAGGVSLWR